VEKNRKAFKLIFPHEFFGAFIDVGNYNKDYQNYIPLLKRFNKKLSVSPSLFDCARQATSNKSA
jgi:hypothetical protein